MGFEGDSNEISLKRHADKTWTACRQDRVLGDVSWTRGKCQKYECGSRQADVHGFKPQAPARRVARWRRRTLSSQGTACARPPQRVLTPRNVDGTRPSDRWWVSAGFSQGPAFLSRPMADSTLRFSFCRSQTRRTQVQLLPIADSAHSGSASADRTLTSKPTAHPADRDSTLVVFLLPSLLFFRLVPHENRHSCPMYSRSAPPRRSQFHHLFSAHVPFRS